jgi:hypothetical protein
MFNLNNPPRKVKKEAHYVATDLDGSLEVPNDESEAHEESSNDNFDNIVSLPDTARKVPVEKNEAVMGSQMSSSSEDINSKKYIGGLYLQDSEPETKKNEVDYSKELKNELITIHGELESDSSPEGRKAAKIKLAGVLEKFKDFVPEIAEKKATEPAPNPHIENLNPKNYEGKGLYIQGNQERAETREKAGAVSDISTKEKATRKGVLNLSEIGTFESEKKVESVQEKSPDEARLVHQAVELAKKQGVEVERDAVKTSEDAYLSAYKDFHSKNSTLKKLFKNGKTESENKELISLKSTYDKNRLAYAEKLQHSVRNRLLEKMEKGKGSKELGAEEKAKERADAILARYNRLIRVREIVKPDLEKKYIARLEAISPKDSKQKEGLLHIFSKGAAWGGKAIKKFNDKVEGATEAGLKKTFGNKLSEKDIKNISKVSARTARILVTTAAFTSAGLATGGLGYGAAGAYAAFKAGKGLVSMALGGTAGAAAGTVYERTGGKKAIKERNVALGSDIQSIKDLEKHAHAEKHGTKEAVEKKRMLAEGLTTGLISGLSSFGFSVEQAHEIAAKHATELANFSHLNSEVHDIAYPGHLEHLPTQEQMNEVAHGHHVAAAHVEGMSHASAPHHEAVHEQATKHHPVETSHHRFAHHPHAAAGQEEVPVATAAVSHESIAPESHVASVPLESHDAIGQSDSSDSPESLAKIKETYSYEQAHGHLPNSTDLNNENDILSKIHEQAPSDTAPVEVHHDAVPVSETHETASVAHTDTVTPETHTSLPVEHSVEVPIQPNVHGISVDPNTPHIYEMQDASTGEKSLAFFEDKNSPNFIEHLTKFAKLHPGKEIYFNSPEPTTLTGTVQPWVNKIDVNAEGDFNIPTTPPLEQLVGVSINPSQFERIIN